MLTPFDRAIVFILPHEEEFARGHWGDEAFVVSENVPGDDGGLTKYGIDQRSHPGVDIEHLTKAAAIDIYRREYWERHNLDALPDKLAIAAMDVWVNGGHASEWLQHAVNCMAAAARCALYRGSPVLKVQPEYLASLKVDGVLGPKSLAAIAKCDQNAILKLFLNERDARFLLLSRNPRMAQFLAGWLRRDDDLRTYLTVS